MVEVPLPQRASKRSVSDENAYKEVELLTKNERSLAGQLSRIIPRSRSGMLLASGAHGLNSVNEVT